MEEFIDRTIGIKDYLVSGVTSGQGSSVGEFSAGSLVKESLLGRGRSWSGPQLTSSGGILEGSGVCAPTRRQQGAPLARRCVWSPRRASAWATAESQGHLRRPGGVARLQTSAYLGVSGGFFPSAPQP